MNYSCEYGKKKYRFCTLESLECNIVHSAAALFEPSQKTQCYFNFSDIDNKLKIICGSIHFKVNGNGKFKSTKPKLVSWSDGPI